MARCEQQEEEHFQSFLAERQQNEALRKQLAALGSAVTTLPAVSDVSSSAVNHQQPQHDVTVSKDDGAADQMLRVVRRADDAGSTKLRAAPEEWSAFAVDDVDGEETDIQDGDLVTVVRVVRSLAVPLAYAQFSRILL